MPRPPTTRPTVTDPSQPGLMMHRAPCSSATSAASERRRTLIQTGVALGSVALGGMLAQRSFSTPPPDPAVLALLSRTMPDAQGQAIPLSTYRGRALIINFWATWCPPCLEEMPELSALAPTLLQHGVQLLGLGIDHAPAIAHYAAHHPTQYPLLVAGLSGISLLQELGANQNALPWTVLITSNGRIQQRMGGRLDTSRLVEQAQELT
jgi:peroxiredoxin